MESGSQLLHKTAQTILNKKKLNIQVFWDRVYKKLKIRRKKLEIKKRKKIHFFKT